MSEEVSLLSSSSSVYDVRTLRGPQAVGDIGRECIALHHLYGADNTRRGNLGIIDEDKIIYIVSNSIIIENIVTSAKEFINGIDGMGIGCYAVHPSKKYIAVGNKGFQPKIYIYNYPDMTIAKVLTGGAERGYASLSFNAEGDKLASVATSPDYILTIWEWQEEKLGLHTKAFGQDVFNVKFSLDDDRRLTTSGTGHIRFWKMAATFTGLKLQGYIGKFGKVELSDISAFIELPDGKVVSGTESGSLLCWEGNFIKCRFTMVGGRSCHSGDVTFVDFDRTERCVITASLDGYIRWWSFDAIDSAEVDADVSIDFELLPIAEYYIGDGIGIRSMTDSGIIRNYRYFLILDTKGVMSILKFPLQFTDAGDLAKLCDAVQSLKDPGILKIGGLTPSAGLDLNPTNKLLNDFHAGSINGMDVSPLGHIAATAGTDGTIRFWDYCNRTMIASRTFGCQVTSICWLPLDLNTEGNTVMAGFQDGVVRMLKIGTESGSATVNRKMAFKPHNGAVLDIAFNSESNVLATSGDDGIIFFFNCTEFQGPNKSWTPLRFVPVTPVVSLETGHYTIKCTKLAWIPQDNGSILCTCSDGILREFNVSELSSSEVLLNKEVPTYEASFPVKEFILKVPKTKAAVEPSSPQKGSTVPSTEGGEGGEAGDLIAPPPSSPGQPGKTQETVEIKYDQVKITCAAYSINRENGGYLASTLNGPNANFYECNKKVDTPNSELSIGLYSSDGKDCLKNPQVTSVQYSLSNKFLVLAASDGSIIVKPTQYMEVFATVSAHNNVCGGAVCAKMSFDDKFLISIGKDGVLAVHKIRLNIMNTAAEPLAKDIEAGVYADQKVKAAPKDVTAIEEPEYLSRTYNDDEKMDISLFTKESSFKLPSLGEKEDGNDVTEGSYSIQDAKLKSEEDARRLTADDLKSKVRGYILNLQREYSSLKAQNDNLPEAVRLAPEEMAVDSEYWKILESDRLKSLEEVHKECAYEAEKALKLKQKVKERLMPELLCEEMQLFSFRPVIPGSKVMPCLKSLRCQALSQSGKAVLDKLKEDLKKKEIANAIAKANELIELKSKQALDEIQERQLKKGEGENNSLASGSMAGTQTKQKGSAFSILRRDMRKQRKRVLAEHLLQKPGENDDDERDLNDISIAQKTVGDYKLKTSSDYEVPPDQRVNATKKLSQIALLEENMIKYRLEFNERFLELRNLKMEIVNSIQRDNNRIREIDIELGQEHLSTSLWEPALDPLEFPDDRDEVTASELTKYKNDRKGKTWLQVNPPIQSILSGTKTVIQRVGVEKQLHVFYEKHEQNISRRLRLEADAELLSTPTTSKTTGVKEYKEYEIRDSALIVLTKAPIKTVPIESFDDNIPMLKLVRDIKKKRMFVPEPTSEQIILRNERIKKLKNERENLLKKNDGDVEAFESALDELRNYRFELLSGLKLAEIKLLTLYQEYTLLLTFESKDDTLHQKQVRCLADKKDNALQQSEQKSKLELREGDLQVLKAKLAAVTAELKQILPDNHPFNEQLMKIYKKKLKRVKQGGNDDEEEEEEEEEEDDDEDDDDDEVEISCPLGCDQSLFDRILDLRERRADIEDKLAETQKAFDDLKKSIDRLKGREKQIVKDAAAAEMEIDQFQLQKQAALNQIKIFVPIKFSQIYCFETSGVISGPTDKVKNLQETDDPDVQAQINKLLNPNERQLVSEIDLLSHVIFKKKSLNRLNDRIYELLNETEQAKVSFKELKNERRKFTKERDTKRIEIAALRKKVQDLQLLKFGKSIDIDEVEERADRTKEEEAEQLVHDAEEKYREEMYRLTKEMEHLQDRLAETTIQNTELLNVVADLTENRLNITRSLNAPQADAQVDTEQEDIRDAEERKRISSYVQLQSREIEALRYELIMLKRKEPPPMMPIAAPPNPASDSSVMTYSQSKLMSQNESAMFPPIPNKAGSTTSK